MSKWLDNAIFYEIYPQSFKDTNADGIGDLNGIIQKLDYIKDLGCNAIWLNPCFKSPFGDAGYDIQDYYTVAPRYGTNQDLVNLFNEVHNRGMHIILDLVPGHTSVEHEWFKQSMQPTRNEYSDRYIWTNSVWQSTEYIPCLRGISQRDGSVALNFFSTQPALNYGYFQVTQPWQQSMNDAEPLKTREAIKDIMRFWLKLGCDGFRVDMAGSLVKNDPNGEGTIKLWQDFRNFLDNEFPNAVMISEWGEPDKSLLGGFHMDFLLHFGPSHYNDLFHCDNAYFKKDERGTAKEFIQKYKENYKKTNGKGLMCMPSGNHDMTRLSKYLDTDEIKVVFAFILTIPGAPFIYYGDEIGMNYIEDLTSVEGGYERTGSRSPMQWDNGINLGFSSAKTDSLYIQQDLSPNRPTVENQMLDENSIYNEVKRLITIRKQNIALQSNATIEWLSDEYPLVYLRKCDTQQVLVIINPSNESKEVHYPCKNIIYSSSKIELFKDVILIDGCSVAILEV